MLRSPEFPPEERRSTALTREDSVFYSPPEAFGPFRVLHQIGAGVLGPVFRAHDRTGDRLVAIKVFRIDLTPERAHELAAELQRLVSLKLSHLAIAAPIAAGLEGSVAYLAMTYVPAESLDVVLRQFGPAPFDDVLRLTTQLAGALDFAGAVGASHGGLHPRDVLVSSDAIRLTGLGIGRALERVGVRAPVRRPYTAPERLDGAEWGRPADVYSLAAIVHELLFGRRIAGSGAEAADAVTEIRAAHSDKLRAAFVQALAVDPATRFANALSFAAALRDAATIPLTEPSVTVQTRGRPERIPADAGDRRLPAAKADDTVRIAAHATEPTAAVTPVLPFTISEGEAETIRQERAQETDSTQAVVDQPSASDDSSDRQGVSVDDFPFRSEGATPVETAPEVVAASPVQEVDPTPATLPALNFADLPPPDEPDAPRFVDAVDSDAQEADRVPALDRGMPVLSEDVNQHVDDRSGASPLAMAAILVLGLTIGAVGGYQFAASRAAARAAATAATSSVAAGHDATEVAVEPPPARSETERPRAPSAAPPSSQSSAPAPAPRPSAPPAAKARAASPPVARAGVGRMLVRSTPSGAQVMINGQRRGTTPLTVRNLPYGTHTLRVARAGYASEERKVIIDKAHPSSAVTVALAAADRAPATSSDASFAGSLAVDSRPSGAAVYLNGRRVGETPTVLADLKAGSYALRLERNGYARWSTSVRVVAGQQGRVTASLDRDR